MANCDLPGVLVTLVGFVIAGETFIKSVAAIDVTPTANTDDETVTVNGSRLLRVMPSAETSVTSIWYSPAWGRDTSTFHVPLLEISDFFTSC